MGAGSLAVLFASLPGAIAQDPEPDPFATQLRAILPAADELEFAAIPWRSQFRAAVAEANRLDRPVLLWAMNGHPLGQT